MSAAQHTPGPWEDDTAIEGRNEQACRAAAAANGLPQHKADSCDDGEHRCPACPFRAAIAKATGSAS